MITPKGLDAVTLLVVPVSLYLRRVAVRLRSLWVLFPAVAGIRHANFWMSRNGRSSLLKLNYRPLEDIVMLETKPQELCSWQDLVAGTRCIVEQC